MSRLVGSALFWVLLVFSIASYPVIHSLRARVPPPPPVFGTLPAFTLVDQSGQSIRFGPIGPGAGPGFDDLRGKVWVATLVSPKDPVSAAFLTRLSSLQVHVENLGADFALVTFCRDETPAELAGIAHGHRASPRLWKLLSGSPAPVRDALVAGLKEAIHGSPGGIDLESLDRGNTLVLIDREGRIRGYFDGSDVPSVNGLLREIGLVANHLG